MKKKLWLILLVAALFCAVLTVSASADACGYECEMDLEELLEDNLEAERGKCYSISDDEDLIKLADYVESGKNTVGVTFYLKKDLDLPKKEWVPIGTAETPFKGTFDGCGFTVTGMYTTNYAKYDEAAFFGCLTGKVMNLGVNGRCEGKLYSGGIAAIASGAEIVNCWSAVQIGSCEVSGGIVGHAIDSTITNCCNYSTVLGTVYGGGIAGELSGQSKVEYCYYTYYSASQPVGKTAAESTASAYRFVDSPSMCVVRPEVNVGGVKSEDLTVLLNAWVDTHDAGDVIYRSWLFDLSEDCVEKTGGRFPSQRYPIFTGTCGDDLTWTYDDEGTLIISGQGTMYDYDFTGIIGFITSAPWGQYYNDIKNVVIQSGVTSIGDYAFSGCSELMSIYFSGNMPTIAPNAFYYISAFAFYPSGDESYKDAVAYGANKLVWLPDDDPDVMIYSGTCGENIVWRLTRSGELKISGSGRMADYDYSSQPWKNVRFCITSVVISDGIENIGSYAFYGCNRISDVDIPDGITSIGDSAFTGCSRLTSVTMPNSVERIGSYAFYNCSGITSVTIPDSVTSIGSYAFYGCIGLESVTMPNSVERIGSYAFYNCSGITSVTIPDSVTSIGSYAFYYCSGLASITIPDSVQSIGDCAFFYCSGLTNVTFEGKPVSIYSDAFYGVTATAYYYLEDGWTASDLQNYGGKPTWKQLSRHSLDSNSLTELPESDHDYPANYNKKFVICSDGAVRLTLTFSADTMLGANDILSVIDGNGKVVASYNGAQAAGVTLEVDGSKATLWLNADDVGTGYGFKLASATAEYLHHEYTAAPEFVWNGYTCKAVFTCTRENCNEKHEEVCSVSDAVTTDPTCTEKGVRTYTASVTYNGNTYTDTKTAEIAMLDHTTSIINAKSATCMENGYTGDTCCSMCKQIIEAGTVITAPGHDYTVTVYAPTCLDEGYTSHACKVCRYAYQDEIKPALGHDFGDWTVTVAPTCTEDGTETRSCSRCGASETREVAAIGHNYADPVYEWNDDNTECIGKRYCRNKDCDECFTEKGVITSTITREAKCETTGELRILASFNCKAFYTQEKMLEIPALGHDYISGVCTRCGAFDPDFMPAAPKISPSITAASGKPTLTWAEVDGAAEYEIYRATSKTGTYSKLDNVTDTIFTDASAKAGTTYYYKIRAVGANGEYGDYSSVVSATCDCAQPVATAKTTGGKLVISWAKVTGATKYEVYRATSKSGTYSKVASTTAQSFTDPDAKLGTTRYYKVKAIASKSAANSAFSEIIAAALTCDQPVVKASIVASSGKIKLTWAKVTGAAKYEVYRATSKTGTYTKLSTVTGTSLTNSSAKAGTTYYYKVKAIASKTAANSDFSAIVSATCDCAQPVVKVSTVAASGKIKLTWAKVDGAAKYEVYRATSKTGTYSKISTVTGTSLTNSSAKAGTTYYYKVKAIANKSAANSAYSAVVSCVCKCAQPVVEFDWNKSGNIVFTWTKVTGAASYKVYRANSGSKSYKLLSEVKGTTYTDKTAKAGTFYSYKFVAVSSKGSSANSSPLIGDACALPAKPANFSISTNAMRDCTAKWSAVSGADGYVVLVGDTKNVSDMGIYKDVTTGTSCALGNGRNIYGSKYTGYFAVAAYCAMPDGSIAISEPSNVVKATIVP